MAWLQAYDPVVTRRDFGRAASAGFDNVRIFLRWEDVQPTSSSIDTATLRQARRRRRRCGRSRRRAHRHALCRAHERCQLDPGVGNGRGRRTTAASAWSRENEPSGPQDFETGTRTRGLSPLRSGSPPPRRAPWPGTPEYGHGISETRTPTAPFHPNTPPGRRGWNEWPPQSGSSDPGRPLTIGIHMEDLEEDRRIGPAEAARWCDFVSMHGYPIYANWSAGATDDRPAPLPRRDHPLARGRSRRYSSRNSAYPRHDLPGLTIRCS